MTYDETLQLMSILKAAHPDYYKGMKPKDAEAIVALWAELLEPFPCELCAFAVKRLILESPYVPKISDIVTRVKEALDTGENDAVGAWNLLSKAAAKASVITAEEYERLPHEAKSFCGGRSGLLSLGMLDSEVFQSVTRGQFFKVYEGLRRRHETQELMPPELRALVGKAVKSLTPTPEPKRFLPEPETDCDPVRVGV